MERDSTAGGTQAGMERLSLRSLAAVPAGMGPVVNPRSLRVGIVHLGIGAFHRAHAAAFTEEAVAAAGGDWGIAGVTERSPAVRDLLAPQDGLYSVLVRDAEATTLRVNGVVREVLCAAEDPAAVVARIADPATRVVTLTVTEKGYRRDAATGEPHWADPEVAADLAGRPPRTPVGQLARGLEARRRAGAGPLSVVSCDNLADNGAVLRALVGSFALRLEGGDALAAWIGDNARFPSTMVDRITPATTPADRDAAAGMLGVVDEGVVVTEPFRQWVIEDDFAAGRPAWERAGAILTGDVGPYERAKVRMLNASHSTIAYLGQLAGYELVSDVMAAHSPIEAAVRRLMSDEVVPTLEPVAGLDLGGYQGDLLARFANPALAHRTAQIAMDGSQKLPQRLIGTVADRRRAGAEPVVALLGVAAWMRYVADRTADDGRPLEVDDPMAGVIAERVAGVESAAAVVDSLLGLRQVVTEEVASDPVVRSILVEHLERLRRDGADAAARHAAGDG